MKKAQEKRQYETSATLSPKPQTPSMERLAQVAARIDRGIGGKYYGADWQLAYEYAMGELVALQREYNTLFGGKTQADSRFVIFYDRIIQVMESAHVALVDSIDPHARKRHVADLVERNKDLLLQNAALDKKSEELAAAHEQQLADTAEREAKQNRRTTYRTGTGGKGGKPPADKK